jgi:amino acid transporter
MAPVGYEELTAGKRIKTFFEGYLAAPIVVLMYVGFKFIKKTKIVRAKDMDVTSRIREWNLEELLAEERAEMANWPAWKRVYKTIC